jgi:uncharacterized protein YecE (DUF72 family)
MQKKFNYDYSETELGDVHNKHLLRMAASAKRGMIFFNNHVRARAPENARRLLELLERQGRSVGCTF